MPSLRCVSRVECAYQRQACKQQHASQSYDCNKVKFDKSGQNGDVCEATQLQADCEAAEAIWHRATATNPSVSTPLLHFLRALNITQPPRLFPQSLYRERGSSSCVHFAFEAANHDMSNVCYNPHTLSQRRDWRTAAQATMDVQTAETRLLPRVPLVPSVPSWLCFGWLVPALQVARLSFGMKGSALDSPHRPQLGEAMTSRTPASWNMSD